MNSIRALKSWFSETREAWAKRVDERAFLRVVRGDKFNFMPKSETFRWWLECDMYLNVERDRPIKSSYLRRFLGEWWFYPEMAKHRIDTKQYQ